MSEDETFLTRWSRRKRDAERDVTPAPAAPDASVHPAESGSPDESKSPQAQTANVAGRVEAAPSTGATPDQPPFDPAALPPVESIGPGTDIRDFLRANVPAELTRAALRRAWSSDPAIRDFIGIAENQWDFTAPDGVPGFGPLTPVDEAHHAVAQLTNVLDPKVEPASAGTPQATTPATDLPRVPQAADENNAGRQDQGAEKQTAPVDNAASQSIPSENAASRNEGASPKPVVQTARRTHGSALPD